LTAELLHAGRVGRPHGLDGSFHVVEPAPRLLWVGAPIWVGERPTEVLRRAGTDDRPILRVGLASDRTEVEALRGEQLRAPRDSAPQLEEDEYWAEDLVGCAVVAGARPLGSVRRLLAYPSCELLELDGGELVPLVRDAIVAVDPAERRIEVDARFLGLDDGEA
jgi:16S rRNA processing protein RimM